MHAKQSKPKYRLVKFNYSNGVSKYGVEKRFWVFWYKLGTAKGTSSKEFGPRIVPITFATQHEAKEYIDELEKERAHIVNKEYLYLGEDL